MSKEQWGHGYHVGQRDGLCNGYEQGRSDGRDLGAWGAFRQMSERIYVLLRIMRESIDSSSDTDSKWIALEMMEMMVIPYVSESILLPIHKTVTSPHEPPS